MGSYRCINRIMSEKPAIDSPEATLSTTPQQLYRKPSTRPATLVNSTLLFSHAHEEHMPVAHLRHACATAGMNYDEVERDFMNSSKDLTTDLDNLKREFQMFMTKEVRENRLHPRQTSSRLQRMQEEITRKKETESRFEMA